jgi:hypothetical protein
MLREFMLLKECKLFLPCKKTKDLSRYQLQKTSKHNSSTGTLTIERMIKCLKGFFEVLYSTLLHLLRLRFSTCAGGCWERTQDCCIDSQTL